MPALDGMFALALAASLVALCSTAWSIRAAMTSVRFTNLLVEAIHALPDGFAVWDKNERLVVTNPAVAEHIGPLAARIGETLEGALRRKMQADPRPCIGSASVEDDIQERLAAHRAPGVPLERQYRSGRWLRISEKQLPSGGVVSLYSDITPQKEVQRRLTEHEVTFRRLIEDFDIGVLIHRDFVPLFANVAAARLLGKASPDEVTATADIRDFLTPESRAKVATSELYTAGTFEQWSKLETTILRPDGKRLWLEGFGAPTLWEGRPARITLAIDGTDRRSAEWEARRQRLVLQQVIDNLPAAVTVKDRDLRLSVWNRHAARLFGRSAEDMVGRRLSEAAPSKEAEMMEAADRQVLASGEPTTPVEVVISVSGESRTIWMSKLPLWAADGTVEGVISSSLDITELRNAERQAREHQQLMTDVIDSLPMCVNVKDLDLRYVHMNKGQAKEFGIDRADAIGHRREDFTTGKMPKEEAQRWLTSKAAKERESIETGVAVLHEEDVYARDDQGNIGTMLTSRIPLKDHEGRVKSLLTIVINTTERKTLERDLARNRRLLQTVIEHIPAGITVKDRDLRMVMINPEAAGPLAQKAEEMIGKRHRDLVTPHHPTLLEDEERRVLETGQTSRAFEFVGASGRTWLGAIAPVAGSDGKPEFVATLAIDITNLKHRQHELMEANRLLERNTIRLEELNVEYMAERTAALEANRSKSQFLAHMSHELRTPLNAVIGFSEIMVGQLFGEMPKRYLGYAEDVLASGRHLLSVIDDLLDLSRIEAGKYELQMSRFAVAEAIKASVDIVKGRARERGQSLTIDIAEGVEAIRADRRAIKQILINLLANAINASPEPGRIAVRVQADDHGTVTLSIEDQGKGMTSEQVERAFDPVWQAEEMLSRESDGTGLGLSICKRLVALHDGEIEIRSTAGVGTVVSVRLPNAVGTPDSGRDAIKAVA